MPRWRRRRDQDPDPQGEFYRLEGEHATDEQPAVDEGIDAKSEAISEVEDETWPEWAYEDRPRRSRSRASKRRRGRRRRAEAEEEVPLFDRAPEEHPEDDPRVWVTDEPGVEEPERWLSSGSAPIDDPVWRAETEQRLRDLGASDDDVELGAEPAVVVEAAAEAVEPNEPYSDEPAYDSRLEGSDEDGFDERERDTDEPDEVEPGYRPVIGDVVPGGVGPRRAALHERKRRKRLTSLIAAAAAIVIAVVLASALSGGDPDDDDDPGRDGSTIAQADDQVESMLLYGTNEDAGSEGASWIALLSIDRAEDRGSVVYLPAHTAVEIPGRGLLPLGEAAAGGDVALLLAGTESLLGMQIDSYLELSAGDARVLLGQLGPLEIEVPSEVSVPAGTDQTRQIFAEGPQSIEGDRLGQLLYVTGVDGDDVELGDRHLAFWDAVFETYGGQSAELQEIVASAGDVLGESDRTPQENADLIAEIAALPEDAISLNTLPVRQVTVGDDELYNVNEEEVTEFVQTTIGARSGTANETRVQILNGNGVPGIGDDVAELLVGEGYRVILSGNYRSLDVKSTLIIAYDQSEEGIALAERARELLGVGEVQISGQDQGIVDLTIVVGKDFLRRT